MKHAFAEPLQQIDRTYVLWRGRKLSYFGGCDYLRLSSHPRIVKAAREGIAKFGLNVAASRRTTGNHPLYEQLESAARKFFQSDRALLVSNGYLANMVAAQGLRERIEHVWIDERAHSSLWDALSFLKCPHTSFSHRDPKDLQRTLRAKRAGVALLTDGMFAPTGALAPLREYRKVIGARALLWVDDAHAAGILGDNGRGSLEAAGLGRENVIQTITFSKAFGAYGGAVLCQQRVADAIIRGSSALAGSTPLPLPFAHAAREALRLQSNPPSLREKLWRNVRRFWEALDRVPGTLSPIIAVNTPHPAALRRALLRAGIHPPFIHYPGGPASGYFRFAISSEHTPARINALAGVLRNQPALFGLDA